MSRLIRDAGAGPSSAAPRQLTLASGRRHGADRVAAQPLRPLIAEFTATFGSTWRPVTQRKHADDFRRFTGWLEANGLPLSLIHISEPTRLGMISYAVFC